MHLRESNDRVLSTINLCLSRFNIAPLPAVSALFASVPTAIATMEFLDPYSPRKRIRYIKPIDTPAGTGKAVAWMTQQPRKIFVYLHNTLQQLVALIEVLQTSGVEAICVFPKVENGDLPKSTGSVRYYNKLIDVGKILPDAAVCISNAGNGLTGMCLQHGVPLLLLPIYLEQHLTAWRVANMGRGVLISVESNVGAYRSALQEVLELSTGAKWAVSNTNGTAPYPLETYRSMVEQQLESVDMAKSRTQN
jgi:hypothetical protein